MRPILRTDRVGLGKPTLEGGLNLLEEGLLEGDRVRLTPMNDDDFPIIAKWLRTLEFQRMVAHHLAYPLSEDKITNQWRNMRDSNHVFMFAIRPASTEELIGWVQMDNVVWHNRVANIDIGIGHVSHRGKGFGAEAMRLALNFAFGELNLHRVQLMVFSYNTRAISMYEKIGFQREGIMREYLQRDGQRYDMYIYSMLCSEWGVISPDARSDASAPASLE